MSERRPYDSPVRRSRAAETRERIVAAGSELVHGFESWEWDQLTFRAVAEQAGVGERTVYRHFPTERQLHEAVMHRLHEEAGVDYEGVTIDNLVEVTGRVLDSMGRYPTAPPARSRRTRSSRTSTPTAASTGPGGGRARSPRAVAG